jgi:acyl carrier protein
MKVIVDGTDNTVRRSQLPLLGAYQEPRSSTEKKLAEIWCRALAMDRVGIKDTYEDLGGDSLLAASIFAEMEKDFNIKIPWALLADADTIEAMALEIDKLR